MSLDEAAARFLASLAPGERGTSQAEVSRFVRWYGRQRELVRLTAPEVASYAGHLSLSDTDYKKKLGLVHAFLAYAWKEGWTGSNLAAHLKSKTGKAMVQHLRSRTSPEAIPLTETGYAALEVELATLKDKRAECIAEMNRAAADKDFRENAPLAAAREQRSHLEGQIRELEETLKSAVLISGKQRSSQKAGIGDSVTLLDLASGAELHYTMVNSREVDPARGWISSASPIGQAVIGHSPGEVVEVIAPAGRQRYRIERVGR